MSIKALIHAASAGSGTGRYTPICGRKGVKRSYIIPGAAFKQIATCSGCQFEHTLRMYRWQNRRTRLLGD